MTMHRRDFILLRRQGRQSTARIDCEKLYMVWQGLIADTHRGMSEAGTMNDSEWWSGEPPLLTEQPNPETFFSDLQSEIFQLDAIEVSGTEWLEDDELRVRLNDMLKAFEIKGGEVRYVTIRAMPEHPTQARPRV